MATEVAVVVVANSPCVEDASMNRSRVRMTPKQRVLLECYQAYAVPFADGSWSIHWPYEFARGVQTIGMGGSAAKAWADAWRRCQTRTSATSSRTE